MKSISPLIADVNECEDNEDGERDWKNEEETRGYDLSQWVGADIVDHVSCHPRMSEILKTF